MEPFLDCYAILEISQDARPEEIAKAFRALAQQFHPDRNSSPDATARFIELKKAYDVLSDPEKRKAYDTTYWLRMKKLGDQDSKGPSDPQKRPTKSQPDPIYTIKHFEPGRSAYMVFHHTTYSLTPNEVARLMQDGMLRGRSEDRSDYLLMYCVHCHALFTRRPGKSSVVIQDLPYEHFPLCPHCQSVDWCPANDALEQRARREKEEQARRWKQAKEEKAKREQEATGSAQMQVDAEAKTIQRTAEQWLQEGYKLRKKNYQEALAAYEQALRLDPNFALAWDHKGVALINLRRYEEGLAACEQALRLNPNSVFARNNKGAALIELGRYEEGLAACEQALRLDLNSVSTWNNKGIALIELGRYEEGLAACEQALHLDPNFALAWGNQGRALYRLKRYEEVLAACEQALRLNPNFALAWDHKGITLIELGRYEEGLAACEQALRLDPNFALAWNNKGRALYRLKRYEEALAAYEQALRLNPNFALASSGKEEVLQNLNCSKTQQVQASKPAIRPHRPLGAFLPPSPRLRKYLRALLWPSHGPDGL